MAPAWIVAAAAAALALVAGLADRRRLRRRELDGPGWMPWPLVQIVAIMAAAVAVAAALR